MNGKRDEIVWLRIEHDSSIRIVYSYDLHDSGDELFDSLHVVPIKTMEGRNSYTLYRRLYYDWDSIVMAASRDRLRWSYRGSDTVEHATIFRYIDTDSENWLRRMLLTGQSP